MPELMIVIAIMGILAGIAIPSWFGVVEGRAVDSGANQLKADMRLSHSRATNQLEPWKVVLTSGSSVYQMGKTGALKDRDFCGDGGCGANDPKVNFSGGGTVTITFNSDGSASVTSVPAGSPTVYKVKVDGNSYYRDLEIAPATSRIK